MERIRAAKELVDKRSSIRFDVLQISVNPEEGADEFARWIRSNSLPDAVVGLTNVTTLSALSAFAQIGIDVPADVLLSGYHDSLWMTARKTPITAIEQPVDDVVRCVWERLQLRIEGSDQPPQHIVLNARLIERASTRPSPQISVA